MIGNKYLSEAIHSEEIQKGTLNLVCTPTGSGKTHWALHTLSQTASKPYRMVYLIDTTNGKEQLLKQENTAYYSNEWRETVQNGVIWFGEAEVGNKIVVMTYAKFGVLAEKYKAFGFSFELIVCDEIHNLVRFSAFQHHKPNEKEWHKMARERLEQIILLGETKVIGLSATPEKAEQMHCPFQYISIDEGVRQFETKEIIPYTNVETLLKTLSPKEKGIAYIGHVKKMKAFEKKAKALGFSAIAIWSVHNKDHPMTQEQMDVRDHILNNSALPETYNLFIINASSETSINIFSQVDYIIIHTQEKEAQTQVRGRYRGDLKRLYVLDYNAMPQVPEEFLGIELSTEKKARLCEALGLRNEKGYLWKWTSVKQILLESGYTIKEGRRNNKWYAVITF